MDDAKAVNKIEVNLLQGKIDFINERPPERIAVLEKHCISE